MADISGFGLRARIVASVTFPSGIEVTQFADDADPLDAPSQQVADKAMGLNGDLITWKKANPVIATLNVVPGGDDDKNLAVLLENNRVGRGKQGARDVITMTLVYPDGSTKNLSAGVITDGMPMNGVASAGRLKSKPYAFAFENISGT